MNTSNKKHYAALGVSAQKEAVHKAVASLDKGLDRYAFCKLMPEHTLGNRLRPPSYSIGTRRRAIQARGNASPKRR